ncbi:MAG: ASCH domain-containing protein [Planctomycetia bacterium]|nr:ASCH domain-containing protein [Planctomycetia bacterium]
MSEAQYALSVKQPWATLLVRGLKTVEVRRWPTARRGPILIHAAQVSADDPAIWALLPDDLRDQARVVGGVIGQCELTGCVAYRTVEDFAADRPRHLNFAEWFQPPVLYGFTVAEATPLPFRPYPGWLRFFPVHAETPRRSRRGGRPPIAGTLFPDL